MVTYIVECVVGGGFGIVKIMQRLPEAVTDPPRSKSSLSAASVTPSKSMRSKRRMASLLPGWASVSRCRLTEKGAPGVPGFSPAAPGGP